MTAIIHQHDYMKLEQYCNSDRQYEKGNTEWYVAVFDEEYNKLNSDLYVKVILCQKSRVIYRQKVCHIIRFPLLA